MEDGINTKAGERRVPDKTRAVAEPLCMESIPKWQHGASEAMAFLLGSRNDERYSDWDISLKQQPECRLDLPDTSTRRGLWTAKMHNSTVCRVLDGLVAAQASGSRQPDDMNEILREIPPRRGVLPIPGPARGGLDVPREERRSERQASRKIICRGRNWSRGQRQPGPGKMGRMAQPSSRQ